MKLVSAAAVLVLASLLTACGGDDEPADPPSSAEDRAASDSGGSGDSGDVEVFSEECLDAFPMAVFEPDMANSELVPDGFPSPPVESTFCLLTGTGTSIEELGYITDASVQEVVDAYVDALAEYDAAPSPDGTAVNAQAGDVQVLVLPQDGKFTIQLSRG